VLGHRPPGRAFEDLDKSLRRLLRDESDGDGNRNTALFDRRDAQTRDGIALRPGALLVREWQGKLERVMVLEEGFAWNGKNFRQPFATRQSDDQHQLERPPVLRAAPDEGSASNHWGCWW